MSFMESNQDDLTSDSQSDVDQTGGQQSSSEGASTSELTLPQLAAQVKRIEKMMSSLQSGKDRGINKAQAAAQDAQSRTAELAEEIGRMQEYLSRYGSTEEAARNMAIDEALFSGSAGDIQSEVSQDGGSADQDQATDVGVDEELLAYMGINPKDPALIRLIQEGKSTLEAAKIVKRGESGVGAQASQAETGKAAGVISSAGGAVSGSATTAQAVLKQQYEQELQQIRRGDVNALVDLKKKYRSLGLDIW